VDAQEAARPAHGVNGAVGADPTPTGFSLTKPGAPRPPLVVRIAAGDLAYEEFR
jgi:hypothetical protein